MKIQVPYADRDVGDIELLQCDVGKVIGKFTDDTGKTWLEIKIDPSKESKIEEILFPERTVSVGCSKMEEDCTYCTRK